MVVENDCVQVFSGYDAKRHSAVYHASQYRENDSSKGTGGLGNSLTPTVFSTRYFYNSAIDKKCVQGLIARGKKANVVAKQVDNNTNVRTRTYRSRVKPSTLGLNHVSHSTIPTGYDSTSQESVTGVLDAKSTPPDDLVNSIVPALQKSCTSLPHNGGLIGKSGTCDNDNKALNCSQLTLADGIVTPKGVGSDCSSLLCDGGNMNNPSALNKHLSDNDTTLQTTITSGKVNGHQDVVSNGIRSENVLIYDVNAGNTDFGIELCDTLLRDGWKKHVPYLDAHCLDFSLWRKQSDFQFGFVPLSNLVLPDSVGHVGDKVNDPIEQHFRVKSTGIPNFLGARIPIESQLNAEEWEKMLSGYWDKQLVHLIRVGFPIDFNRSCHLTHEDKNHSSAVDYPEDIKAYLNEEIQYGAIIGPFQSNPIPNCHVSPFMTREKPNASNRRVIIDLSWPKHNSVNDGVDKNSYLGSEFSLTFPTIDDITNELVKIGPGSHIYKIDISRAFRHLKIDPLDYDLLGLRWDATFIDTCLPFGSRHGSQNFQCVSDAVRYVLRCHGYGVINYIDDFVGYGTPDVARRSFDCLRHVLERLGLTISEKKLVAPCTRAVCLGVLIDTENGTVSIPDDKLRQINDTVKEWQDRSSCSKRQLQSLLGQLLYIHKCVRPARTFLNRMLELLRQNYDAHTITLTQAFKRDLRWFSRFLQNYNGMSMYIHRRVDHVVELDACLDGLGAVWKNYVYHLPIPRHYLGLTIVHLEMINILVAIKVFGPFWASRKILVKCDNQAVVAVLRNSRTKDAFLAACARNIWLMTAWYDLEVNYVHIKGKNNVIADLLSRWCPTAKNIVKLSSHIPDPLWLEVPSEFLELDNEI